MPMQTLASSRVLAPARPLPAWHGAWPSRARAAGCAAVLAALAAWVAPEVQAQGTHRSATPASPNAVPGLDGELLYQLLISEMQMRAGEPTAAYALMLDAARRTTHPQLYQRAVEIALQGRAGDSALQAARAWRQAHPQSREPVRFELQVLVALGRIADTAEPLKRQLALSTPEQREATLAVLPRLLARAPDKKLAARVAEEGLADALAAQATGSAAWTAVGRLRLAAEDPAGALAAAQSGMGADAAAEGPVYLALEMMEPRRPDAEALVRAFLQRQPDNADVRFAYARALIDDLRYAEASTALDAVTRLRPEFAEAWLALGTLLTQDARNDAAQSALERYIQLMDERPRNDDRARGLAQAYLSMAQLAERRRDFAAAENWLSRIDNADQLISAQSRRASLLARQGRLDDARALLAALPERSPDEARAKRLAQVQLLRDVKQYQAAYDLLAEFASKESPDSDVQYDLAMLAEKVGRHDEMERLLRGMIAVRPSYHHAFNALGYSLADRGVRLPEAKQLIQKALELAPGDAYITDSLGWVEFRLGNLPEALRLLELAYKTRPDAEIAAHLGEVLWVMGQRDRARTIWLEGRQLNAENETLQETLKRLQVSL